MSREDEKEEIVARFTAGVSAIADELRREFRKMAQEQMETVFIPAMERRMVELVGDPVIHFSPAPPMETLERLVALRDLIDAELARRKTPS